MIDAAALAELARDAAETLDDQAALRQMVPGQRGRSRTRGGREGS